MGLHSVSPSKHGPSLGRRVVTVRTSGARGEPLQLQTSSRLCNAQTQSVGYSKQTDPMQARPALLYRRAEDERAHREKGVTSASRSDPLESI